jgi:hypothetical protein
MLSLLFWRTFPWDIDAVPGEPFSPEYIPPKQGSGRFDLGGVPSVLYLAESEVHAIGEKIQRYRGQRIADAELREFGRQLATVEVTLDLKKGGFESSRTNIVDLCDPKELDRYGIRPDELMSRDLMRTQSIAHRLYQEGLVGFRCWSSISGDWHSVVLFLDRVSRHGRLRFGSPRALRLDTPALLEAASMLSIAVVPVRS